MKNGMNSPVCQRKFEADCHWTKTLGDSKRADNFGSKFITNGAERNILGGKPHFLTNDVNGRLRPVAIGLSLSACAHLKESLPGLPPGAAAPLDKSVGQRKPRLRIPDWEK